MAYWTIPVRNHEGGGSCSDDQYHHLKMERDELARKCSHSEDRRHEASDKTNRGVPDKIQSDYKDLFEAYIKLQREHRALATKHKSTMQLNGKLRSEIQTLKLRCSNPTRRKPIVDRKNAANEHGTDDNKENVQNTLDLGKMQLRLNSAETQLQMFRREDGVSTTKVSLTMMHFIRSH